MTPLQQKINAIIESRVKASIDEMLSAMGNGAPTASTEPTWKATEPTPRRSRKRGRGRARIAYVLAAYNKKGRRPIPELFPTALVAWKALAAAKKPLTARELEKATGLGQKTVESVVWFLRNNKMVNSQPIATK